LPVHSQHPHGASPRWPGRSTAPRQSGIRIFSAITDNHHPGMLRKPIPHRHHGAD
jgi:hypothetical protein